jgi:hypothetical protein
MPDKRALQQVRTYETDIPAISAAEQAISGAPFLRKNKQFPLARDPVPRGRQITKTPTPCGIFTQI